MCGGPIAWYHAAMMAAMAWMYAVMGKLIPGQGGDSGQDGHGGHAGHTGHAGHAETAPAPPVDWAALLNWACTLGFGAAAVYWLYRLVIVRLRPPSDGSDRVLGIACQMAMATGMAVMFAVML